MTDMTLKVALPQPVTVAARVVDEPHTHASRYRAPRPQPSSAAGLAPYASALLGNMPATLIRASLR